MSPCSLARSGNRELTERLACFHATPTRVREVSIKPGTRRGVLRGLTNTVGVIASDGIVRAARFAALSAVPILFLLQLAMIVNFSVLFDTFTARTLLVPAFADDIDHKAWWPSKLGANPHNASSAVS